MSEWFHTVSMDRQGGGTGEIYSRDYYVCCVRKLGSVRVWILIPLKQPVLPVTLAEPQHSAFTYLPFILS